MSRSIMVLVPRPCFFFQYPLLRMGRSFGVATLETLVVYHRLALKAGLLEPHKDLPSWVTSPGRDSGRELIPAHHINKQTKFIRSIKRSG